MKKILISSILIGGFLASNVYAKQVAFCMAYFIGANSEMTCQGDIEGKYTPVQLYHKDWTLKTDISGTNKFVLVFEK